MAPEHQSTTRAFYDRESEEPRGAGRRRRPAADWGVGEDVFDRLPSRNFIRADRRRSGPAARGHADAGEWREIDLSDATNHEDWPDDGREAWREEPRAARDEAGADDDPAQHTRRRRFERPADDWFEPERGISRTIVLGPDDADPVLLPANSPAAGSLPADVAPPVADDLPRAEDPWAEEPPAGRRTIVIHGRPDRLPAPRASRPPRTAIERVGASPDRIAAYAVALGLLLILIAVFTH